MCKAGLLRSANDAMTNSEKFPRIINGLVAAGIVVRGPRGGGAMGRMVGLRKPPRK